MATPSRVDVLMDDAQCAREDALGVVLDAQHAVHNVIVAARAAWEALGKAEEFLAGADGRGEPGVVFVTLAALRESPAFRRAQWDGTDRRGEAVAS